MAEKDTYKDVFLSIDNLIEVEKNKREPGDVWYIVSAVWWKQWKEYSTKKEAELSSSQTQVMSMDFFMIV